MSDRSQMGGKGQAQCSLLDDDALPLPIQFVGNFACRKRGFLQKRNHCRALMYPTSRHPGNRPRVPRKPLRLQVLPEPHDRARDVGRRDRSTRRNSGIVGVAHPLGECMP